jgi:hypothetical protein
MKKKGEKIMKERGRQNEKYCHTINTAQMDPMSLNIQIRLEHETYFMAAYLLLQLEWHLVDIPSSCAGLLPHSAAHH